MSTKTRLFDSLYGQIEFSPELQQLLLAPIVQRLRHVKLSNIDSLAMPGISGGSRYEHVIGVAHLASKIAFAKRLPTRDFLCLTAAALLHDWAITAFGHLVEEGFAYSGIRFDHEQKLQELAGGSDPKELGGVNRQLFCGREPGLMPWINSIVPQGDRDAFLVDIVSAIQGKGKFGKVISGEMDIDNIDGVYRIAYHIGLNVDRQLPQELVSRIVALNPVSGLPRFLHGSEHLIEAWLSTRSQVYRRLMPAQPDFAAKLMLLRCTILACAAREIQSPDWNLTDFEFISKLKHSESIECRKTVERWQVGEFWDTTPLFWMSGTRPSFVDLADLSAELARKLRRDCLAYAIKDKRTRLCRIEWDDGEAGTFGDSPNGWLFGVGSPVKRPFSQNETNLILQEVHATFDARVLYAEDDRATSSVSPDEQYQLL
ncbi:hypothetical protein PLCT2_02984 [Planctomycetaceae bacterium]|nr:hypothetical protein PLCT2_02984 [Planctomycetaceae bacterium]